MEDHAADKDFVRRFRDAALGIARRKMDDVVREQAKIETVVPLGPRMGTGGHFGGFFLWDTAFAVSWGRYAPGDWPLVSMLDNFRAVAEPDGYIGREFTPRGTPVWSPTSPISFNPPLLAWAERLLADAGRAPAGPAQSGEFYEYEVQSGQTLSEIARAFGCTVKEIMQASGIQDAAKIRVGQKIYIPAK